MKISRLPFVSQVVESGADDRVFDGLLLAGPFIILIIAVAGRSLFTHLLAASYIAVFAVHILLNAMR